MTQASKTTRSWSPVGRFESGTLIAVVVPTALLSLVVLGVLPPLTVCNSDSPLTAGEYWFRATKTVVEPWRGPHHVYGIFTVPEQFKFDHLYTAKLTVQGMPTRFTAGSPEDEDVQSVRAHQGYYTKRVYLSTRTALWFLFTGRFGDLRSTCHWWLVLSDRSLAPN